MSKDQNQQKTDVPYRVKMISEEDHKKRLAKEVEQLRNTDMSYTISHGTSPSGDAWPRIRIEINGGNPLRIHELALKLEFLILEYAANNPPNLVKEQCHED